MNTIGTTPRNPITIQESYAIALGFTTADTLSEGQFVKLNSDGSVSAVAASTDKPLGYVASGYKKTDDATVRVVTPFNAIAVGKASATLDEGNALACTGFDGTTFVPIYKVAASADYVVATCLVAAASGAEAKVGILRQPYLKP